MNFLCAKMPFMLDEVIRTIPQCPGSYALWLHLHQAQNLTVGKLGYFTFPTGDYVYLGSARGSGGLRARLGRYLRGDGKPHWHIDHLRAAAQVNGFGYTIHRRDTIYRVPAECDWSQKLASLPETSIPVPGFGSSDCRSSCPAHLVYLQTFDTDLIDNLLNCEFHALSIE